MPSVSVWERESFYAPADVVIAGSGLVGLWSAYFLKKRSPKLRVTIVDRGIIPTGASTRNAGFACFGSITELIADTLKMGEDKMLDLVEMRYKGLERIRKTFKNKDISYENLGGYELITHSQEMDLNILRSNIDWLNQKLKKIVGEKAFYLRDEKISSLGLAGVQHLVENKAEGQLHSGKLCQQLLRLVQSLGVTVLNATEINAFETSADGVEIQTSTGTILSARKLLICTNAFARQLLPSLDVEPARGQVLVTSEIPNLLLKGAFHFDEGYYYFRNLGNRVLLGGARNMAFEDEHTHSSETSEQIQQELERFLRETIIPERTFTVDYRWGGIMGIGGEKMPIMREVSENVFCAVRMSGMGVALAPWVGEHMAKKMT